MTKLINRNMKIFVTGASGFIGNNLASRLAAENNDVTILLRNLALGKHFTHKGIRVVPGDIANTEILKSGMEGCEQVFHLAAYARPVAADKDLPWKTNVEGTRNILNAAHEQGIKKVIITSTAGTIGWSRNGLSVDEQTLNPPEFYTAYEKTKAAVEKMAFESSSDKMEVIVVNPTRVFGPGRLSESNSVTKIINLYGRGLWRIIPGDGNSIGNYAFIDDVVNGHILAARHGKGGERYILGGENLSFMELFDTLGRVFGKKRYMFKISSSGLKRIAHAQDFLSQLARRPPMITGSWIDKYLRNWIMSSNKAIMNLSYSVTPFEEGVARTVEWLKSGRKGYDA
jgi:farnesol dehydrogenase